MPTTGACSRCRSARRAPRRPPEHPSRGGYAPPVAVLVDRALCLHRTPFSESSLVVHVITARHGRVHLLARGAYRTTSRYFAVLDLFDELELEWDASPRRELQLLRSGTVHERR